MRFRVGWIVGVWFVIVTLAVMSIVTTGLLGKYSQALLFFVPSVLAFSAGAIIVNSFSKRDAERKTWFLFTLGSLSLVIAEAFRAINHLLEMLPNWFNLIPYPFILICFIFLIWGFWYQQSLIKTKIGTNVRVLIAIIISAFAIVLIFLFTSSFLSTNGSGLSDSAKIFTIAFLLGDLFMFSGAVAISLRMWGGRLSLPWNVWSLGTIILVAYHIYFTIILANGNNPVEYGTGILLAIGLGLLATSSEWRRSLLE